MLDLYNTAMSQPVLWPIVILITLKSIFKICRGDPDVKVYRPNLQKKNTNKTESICLNNCVKAQPLVMPGCMAT